MNRKNEDAPVIIFKEKESEVQTYQNYNTIDHIGDLTIDKIKKK